MRVLGFLAQGYVVFIAPLLLMWLYLQPVPGEPVAVFSNPIHGAGEAVAIVVKADGLLVGAGGVSSVTVAQSDDPAFIERLYDAGALFVTRPIAAACFRAIASLGSLS